MKYDLEKSCLAQTNLNSDFQHLKFIELGFESYFLMMNKFIETRQLELVGNVSLSFETAFESVSNLICEAKYLREITEQKCS